MKQPPSATTLPRGKPAATTGLPFDLAAVVLMAGAVRQTDLARAAGRARLDLPILPDASLGDCWAARVATLRHELNAPNLPMVVSTNAIAGTPKNAAAWPQAAVRMDSEEPRGSGGALRDIAHEFDADSYMLIVPAQSFPRAELEPVLRELASVSADAMIHADSDRTPSGCFLLRCGAMQGLPARGFIDLKEQALPQIRSKFDVRVVCTNQAPPLPIRTLDGYVQALRAATRAPGGVGDSQAEEWQWSFALAEDGADVHSTARLHDSVVLSGGKVGRGAVVVRCLVGPGGVVESGSSNFDELVGVKSSA